MERRPLADGLVALVSPALERRGVLAAFSERTGGGSPPPFDSLNLGLRTGDRGERVVANRRRLVDALGIGPFATAEQVHGNRVVRIGPGRSAAGFVRATGAILGADALAVTRPRLPVAVLVADCVPLVIASEGLVVAVHAGWRGLAAGIVERALAVFPGARPSAAAVGPAIGACHYEVGEDVAAAVEAGSPAGARVQRRHGRTFLDLPGTVGRILRGAGVRSVDLSEECTACHPDRFFSHRRDGATGRQAAVAMRL
jgi:polyphenol oxidase